MEENIVKNIPKYIRDKCKHMEALCSAASTLRMQVEKWCESNGIDTCSEEWEENVRDEIGGCDAILDPDEIEKLLNKN